MTSRRELPVIKTGKRGVGYRLIDLIRWQEERIRRTDRLSLTLLACKHRFAAMDVTEMARLGGKARAAKLNGKRRSEIARKAARARWRKRRNNPVKR